MLQDKTGLLVTVSSVDVSDDLRFARIFYTVLGDEDGLHRVKGILEHAAGHIQRELAHKLRIRRMPEISLHYDKSLVEGLRLTSLIDEVSSESKDEEDQTGNY
jgi:ribosome-binding factor A